MFTVRLLIPVDIAYLDPPKKYHEELRLKYEKTTANKAEMAILLNASYITELEDALDQNIQTFRRKSHFYYSALIYALLSIVPYLVCLGFHLFKKEDKVHKVEIVHEGKKI